MKVEACKRPTSLSLPASLTEPTVQCHGRSKHQDEEISYRISLPKQSSTGQWPQCHRAGTLTELCSCCPTTASMEEELTCSVCRDLFSQSQPLPCGHSFCPSCIREAWSNCKRFTCPQCQDEPGEVLCDCCPAEAEKHTAPLAVKTCLRCEVSLCPEHLHPHLERPAFSSHLLVDPLSDLSLRRCPAHAEIFRYYCADERIYVCGDCLLDGGHAEHQVKALRQVEADLKVILNTLLRKAEEKIQNGERILKEHENIDCTITESLKEDNAQVERMGTDLEAQVKKLVLSLRALTEKQRQQITEQVHKDCTKVRHDMSQTRSIQHYLAALLAETDPYLLIWTFSRPE